MTYAYDNEATWGRQMVYNIGTDNKVCVRKTYTGARFDGINLEISNWRDRQRELRALIFLPNDNRNFNPKSSNSDVPALRYGETEFPYEGHQERLDLRDTSMIG